MKTILGFLLFSLFYFFIGFLILKLVKRKSNIFFKSLSLSLLINMFFLTLIILLEEQFNISDSEYRKVYIINFLYQGIMLMSIWFVPHILTLIGVIGWGVNVLKERKTA